MIVFLILKKNIRKIQKSFDRKNYIKANIYLFIIYNLFKIRLFIIVLQVSYNHLTF